MKALKTKVILSGIVLVFAFIATIGTTFAWFTVSQTATVEEMTLNVTSADNLLLKAYDSGDTYIYDTGNSTADPLNLALASSYETNLTNENLYNAGYLGDWDGTTLTNPWRLSPVTVAVGNGGSVFGKDFHELNSDINTETRSYSVATANDNAGNYIQLQFVLYSQSEDAQDIYLENLNVVSNSNNTALQSEIANAVRISVWANSDFDTGDTKGFVAREADNDATLVGLTSDYGYTFTGDFAFTEWNTYSATKMVEEHAATAPAVTAVTLPTNSTGALFTIQPSTPTLVNVVIYVEGWQQDADNDISEGAFDITFGFKSTPSA